MSTSDNGGDPDSGEQRESVHLTLPVSQRSTTSPVGGVPRIPSNSSIESKVRLITYYSLTVNSYNISQSRRHVFKRLKDKYKISENFHTSNLIGAT